MKKITRGLAVLTASAGVFLASASLAFAAFENPLSNVSDIPSFIATALRALVIVALPIITIFIVVAGFMFISARGNESKLTEAKKNFFYVIIGALLILGAWVLATIIGATVAQVVGK